mmetsp:Transcript_12683/g.21347  ORF Transcript_12683/g.21347 Transcript_12683/m.21347 type:complete len:520 (-) Transcript_12683:1285-2844(-)
MASLTLQSLKLLLSLSSGLLPYYLVALDIAEVHILMQGEDVALPGDRDGGEGVVAGGHDGPHSALVESLDGGGGGRLEPVLHHQKSEEEEVLLDGVPRGRLNLEEAHLVQHSVGQRNHPVPLLGVLLQLLVIVGGDGARVAQVLDLLGRALDVGAERLVHRVLDDHAHSLQRGLEVVSLHDGQLVGRGGGDAVVGVVALELLYERHTGTIASQLSLSARLTRVHLGEHDVVAPNHGVGAVVLLVELPLRAFEHLYLEGITDQLALDVGDGVAACHGLVEDDLLVGLVVEEAGGEHVLNGGGELLEQVRGLAGEGAGGVDYSIATLDPQDLKSVLGQRSCLVEHHDLDAAAHVYSRGRDAEYLAPLQPLDGEGHSHRHGGRQGGGDRDGDEVERFVDEDVGLGAHLDEFGQGAEEAADSDDGHGAHEDEGVLVELELGVLGVEDVADEGALRGEEAGSDHQSVDLRVADAARLDDLGAAVERVLFGQVEVHGVVVLVDGRDGVLDHGHGLARQHGLVNDG